MGEPVTLPAAVEPTTWNICFHRTAASRFWSLVAMGYYKHVSAFAYLPGIRGWLVYDPHFSGTRLIALPDTPEGFAVLNELIRDCDIVRMERQPGDAKFLRLGFWCVPAIKHLLGMRSRALRPDLLWQHCLHHGGEIIGQARQAGNTDRPAIRCDEGAGRAGQDGRDGRAAARR